MAKKGRRNVSTQEVIEERKQTIAVTPNANRPFIFDKPAAPAEEVHRSITVTATRVFVGQQFLTPLASREYWTIKHSECANKMEQGKQYCIIHNATLTTKEIENICLALNKYICFMCTLLHYTE